MQRILAGSSLLLPLLLSSCPSVQMREWQETQTFRLVVSARVTSVPEGARRIRLWVPAPITIPGMELRSPLTVSSKGARIVERSDAEGNRYLYMQVLPKLGEEISLRYEVKLACSSLLPPPRDGSSSGLWESGPKQIDGDQELLARIRKKALMMTAQHPTWFGKAIALAAWLLDDFREGPSQGLAQSFTKMSGDGLDMCRLYTLACRTLGIPARIEAGYALPRVPPNDEPKEEGPEPLDEVLIWAKIQIPGMDWIPVDLREARRRPIGWRDRFGGLAQARIRLSSGEKRSLEPPLSDWKPSLFLRPHAECDGKAWTGLETTMTVEAIASPER